MTADNESVARLRGHFERDPQNPDLACAVADASWSIGDNAGARSALESLSPPAAEVPGVRFRRARCALIDGDYAAAAGACAAMLEDGVDSAAVRHDHAFALLCLRRTEEAESAVMTAIELFGPSPEALVLRARIESMRGGYAEAAASAAEAVALRPDDASAYGVMALALFDGGDADGAMRVVQAALALDAGQHEALLVASTVSLWRMDVDAAGELFQRALARHPNSGRALSGYGQVLMLRNALPDASATLEHAVAAMPDHIGTWHALAWAYLLQGRIDDAERCYRGAYDIDRNFGDTHGGFALVEALRGRFEEADHIARRALRLDPQAATARYARALVMEARGDAAGAEAELAALLPARDFPGVPIGTFASRLKARLVGGTD